MHATLIAATPETKRHLPRRHAAGQVTRLRRGLYALDPGEQARVAAAAVRLDAVASHETAAALWAIPALGRLRTIHLTRVRRCQERPGTRE